MSSDPAVPGRDDDARVGGTTFVPLTFSVVEPDDDVRTATSPERLLPSQAARLPIALVTDGSWPSDVEITGGGAPGYTVRGASVRGVAHRASDVPRQDALTVCYHHASESVVFAVTDGVSQSRRSDLGAKLLAEEAVRRVCWLLTRHPRSTPDALATGLETMARRVVKVSQAIDADITPTDLASTLVLGIVGKHSVRAVLVGDAALWKIDANGHWTSLFGSRSGEVRENSTAAMPMHPQHATAGTFALDPGDIVIGVTDGVDDPLATGNSPAAAFLAERWATPPDQLQFAIDLSFEAGGYDDDRTAVAVWR